MGCSSSKPKNYHVDVDHTSESRYNQGNSKKYDTNILGEKKSILKKSDGPYKLSSKDSSILGHMSDNDFTRYSKSSPVYIYIL